MGLFVVEDGPRYGRPENGDLSVDPPREDAKAIHYTSVLPPTMR
jgi:hypothetical protein